jgi:signal transduction histidine kinase
LADLPEGFLAMYRAETHSLLVDRVRLSFTVGIALYGVFWFLDLLAAPGQRWTFLTIRSVVVVCMVLTIAMTYTPWGNKYTGMIAWWALFIAATGISLMTVYIGGFSSDYYIGIMLVLFYVGLFMPWPIAMTVAFCAGVCGVYFGLNLVAYGPSVAALSAGFFLFGTCAATILATITGEGGRRRDLMMRRNLQVANEELQRLGDAKTRFFANVSHELRTPLMLILGPLQTLVENEPKEKQKEPLLQAMVANANRLLRQVNMLLDISKLDAGRLRCDPQDGNIGSILDMLVKSAKPYALEKGITIESEGTSSAPDSVFDPQQVETIAANLVSNALKFTPDGGRVSVKCSADNKCITFSVSDTGPGISSEEQSKVFERFHQVAGAGNPEGTGLGLALVKELVDLHGGEVTLRSEPGDGASFRVRLPRSPPVTPARRQTPRRQADRAAQAYLASRLAKRFAQTGGRAILLADVRGPALEQYLPNAESPKNAARILVVEDNSDLRSFLCSRLSRHYRVDAASDGQEGIDLARRVRPDLILSDVMMPRVSGHELCAILKKDPRTRMIPLILLTAKAGTEAVVEGLNVGADDYITKPFDLQELDARVRSHLRARKLERQLDERESRLAAIGQYASSVVHDMRNPLQAIVIYAELASMAVKESDPESATLEDLSAISLAADRLSTMLSRVVEFARRGSMELKRKPTDIGRLVERTCEYQRPFMEKAGIELHLELEEIQDLEVEVDRSEFPRVLENLLNNAREALDSTESPQIYVRATKLDEAVEIRVSDNGHGISPEIRQSLFEPFMSVGKTDGTGLGLAIVSNIVTAHGGTVQAAEESPNGGAVFVVTVPNNIPEDLPSERIPHRSLR